MIRQWVEQNSPLGLAMAALVFFCLLFAVIVWKIWRTPPAANTKKPEDLPFEKEN